MGALVLLGVGTVGSRRSRDRPKISQKSAFPIKGDDKVVHPGSRVDLGSSHHFMHNGEEMNLETTNSRHAIAV